MNCTAILCQLLLLWALFSLLLIAALLVVLFSLVRQLPRRRGWIWRCYYRLRWSVVPALSRTHTTRDWRADERETRVDLAAVALAEYERQRSLAPPIEASTPREAMLK
ncbi:hypothetical protein [Ktedonospora formicarum]|uniref:Uncharacterized protein n=1 Tax=Ktedonospora formicarum TaxID=2778364 RepID=A0A8J3IDY4_9CHLR|nr:hypothetical protein [Ktedonospora formicarum]GHO51420.1 hypothetical protein KSX_95830 [Ktedonospora formicarum]